MSLKILKIGTWQLIELLRGRQGRRGTRRWGWNRETACVVGLGGGVRPRREQPALARLASVFPFYDKLPGIQTPFREILHSCNTSLIANILDGISSQTSG